MPDQSESPATEPGFAEVGFYLGTGAFVSFVLVFAIGLSIYGYHESSDARDDRVSAASAEEDLDAGADVYALRCASCHGPNGEGGVGPGFAGVTERIPDPVDHAAVVSGGQGQMPAFGDLLSAEQIDLVVEFERTELSG